MKDGDLETLLQRYRPAGPPSGLREAVVRSNRAEAGHDRSFARLSVREWSAVAASLLLAAIFYGMAAIERERVTAMLGPPIDAQWSFEELQP